MKLTNEHIGKKVCRVGERPDEGELREIRCTAIRGYEYLVGRFWLDSDGPYGIWELVPDAPAGLSLLEAMQSGKEFRDVRADSTYTHYLGWLKVNRSGQLYDIAHAALVYVSNDVLTARYELREPKKVEVTAETLDACWGRWTTRNFNPPLTFKDYLKKELGL